jgi:hypothetical protein
MVSKSARVSILLSFSKTRDNWDIFKINQAVAILLLALSCGLVVPSISYADLINRKGEHIEGIYHTAYKPIPGWKFQKGDGFISENLAELSWQIAPNGVLYKLGETEYARVAEGRLQVTVGQKQGYVDLAGNLVIPAVYSDAKSFSNGYAVVKKSTFGPVQIIDTKGNVVDTLPSKMLLVPEDAYIERHGVRGHGLLEVLVPKDNSGFGSKHAIYSIKQKRILPMPDDFSLTDFCDGMNLFSIMVKSDDARHNLPKIGYINEEGVVVIPASFDDAGQFGDGLAPVYSKKENRWYYIDKHGKEAITLPANCWLAARFSEGRAAIGLHPSGTQGGTQCVRGDRIGFIDVQGKLVIPAKFFAGSNRVCGFSNGLCAIRVADDLLHYYGFIDRDGKWVISPKYIQVTSFEDHDMAAVFAGPTEFSKKSWDKKSMGWERVQEFQLFLKQYGLLGLSKAKVLQLLGAPDQSSSSPDRQSYTLMADCISGLGVDIEFENDVVKRYRYNSERPSEWFDAHRRDTGDGLSFVGW